MTSGQGSQAASPETVAVTVRDNAELERTITTYTAQGYIVTRHNDAYALLIRQHEPQWWAIVLGGLLGGWATSRREYVDIQVGASVQEAFHPVSEDNNWWWDGKRWVSTARMIPPDAPRSIDQLTWWNGREWRPVPQPMSGWHPAAYTSGKIPSFGNPATRVIRSDHFSLLMGLTVTVVLSGLGILGIMASLPLLVVGCFLGAFVTMARTVTSPPMITIDAGGIHATSRLRQFTVPWSRCRNITTDASASLVCFDASGCAWPWRLGKASGRKALLRARWFRLDGDYLAAAVDEMSTVFREGSSPNPTKGTSGDRRSVRSYRVHRPGGVDRCM